MLQSSNVNACKAYVLAAEFYPSVLATQLSRKVSETHRACQKRTELSTEKNDGFGMVLCPTEAILFGTFQKLRVGQTSTPTWYIVAQ